MPISLDPAETFELVLDSDLAAPEGARPAFLFRYQTYRQYRESSRIAEDREKLVGAVMDKAYIAASEHSAEEIFAVLNRQFAGSRNLSANSSLPAATLAAQAGTQGKPALEDVLMLSEAVELFYGAMRQSRLSVAEKNASESPSPSGSAKSAPAVAKSAGTAAA